MKITLILLFTFSVFAADKAEVKKEVDLAVSTVYEKRNEQQIVENNDVLKNCKVTHKDDVDAAEVCIKEAIQKLTDKDIEKLGDNIKLRSYDTKASKSAKTIREYLTERMSNALRGAPKKGVKEISLKEMKFVDHALYSKIYRSQIGKNILLETTNYCISNFGDRDSPNLIIIPPLPAGTEFQNPKGQITGYSPDEASIATAVTYDASSKKFTPTPRTPLQVSSFMSTWEDAYEYETCDENKDDPNSKCYYGKPDIGNKAASQKGKVSHRSTDAITEFKNAEFDFGPGYMKGKISYCTQVVVKNMCERYRCMNVYGTDVSDDIKKNCKEVIKIEVTAKPDNYVIPVDPIDNDVSGIKACGLIDRLKEYRKVIGALDEIDKLNDENSVGDKGFAITSAFAGRYSGGKGEKSIEDITTIASSEFKDVKFVDEAEIQKLRDECFESGTLDESNDKCKALVENELDEEKNLSLRAEMEAETSAYLERVKNLKEKNDKEGLLEFLKEQGLDKKYGDLEPKELARLISNQYKSQRASLKKSMMDKYNQTRNLVTSSMSDEEKTTAKASKLTEVAKSNIVNMEKEKEKLETLLQYNNILTSYLGATIDDGKDKTDTSLSYQRQIEMDLAKKSGDDEFVDEYSKFFDNGQEAQSTQDANLQVDINFIDSLLGNEEQTDAKLEEKESE